MFSVRNLTALAVTGTLAVAGVASADLESAMQDGGDRLVDKQYSDGLWGWPIDVPPTYTNITGPIGMGLLEAYKLTGDASHLDAAKKAGDALVARADSWVGTYNPEFLVELGAVTGDATYTNKADDFFTQLGGGTYVRNGTNHTTASFISTVEAARSLGGNWPNLRPWEFAPLAITADRLGKTTERDAFVEALQNGLDTLTNTKAADILGLAGGIRGLATLGLDFDPTAGAFAAASSIQDLADELAGLQNANGSWYYQTGVDALAENEEIQTTAYAMLALLEMNGSGQYDAQLLAGREYLLSKQLANGGWDAYLGGDEYAEINGEALWALGATAAVPTPAAAIPALAMMGLLALRRRRAEV